MARRQNENQGNILSGISIFSGVRARRAYAKAGIGRADGGAKDRVMGSRHASGRVWHGAGGTNIAGEMPDMPVRVGHRWYIGRLVGSAATPPRTDCSRNCGCASRRRMRKRRRTPSRACAPLSPAGSRPRSARWKATTGCDGSLAARQPDHSLISTSMLVMVGKCLFCFRLTVNATPLRLPAMKPVLPSRSDTASCSGGVSCL